MHKSIISLTIFIVLSCLAVAGFFLSKEESIFFMKSKRNRLGEEKSPYLLQHKDNPIHWYSWGEEALQAAKKEDKSIFLSIGYSTCYWCHVMEKESFESEEVASILNEHFISIKLDREERPDIDEIYMDAVVSITGQGGWPLTVFLTSEGKPFWGGTYFPKKNFIEILKKINELWNNNRNEILASSNTLFTHLKEQMNLKNKKDLSLENMKKAKMQLMERFDKNYGGFGVAPKFPPAMEISLLIRLYKKNPEPAVLNIITKTLDRMACGGIYDQIGGGFHRYSTDEFWFEPHFEKMLYTNALLSFSYLEAWQITKDTFYKEIATETLNYILREMTSSDGAFYSAQDAGDLNREGEYYTWGLKELKDILTNEEWREFSSLYEIKKEGNFHNGKNILWIKDCSKRKQRNTKLILSAKEKLLKKRKTRFFLHKDDKILSAWNALVIASLAKVYKITKEEKYLKAARTAARFLQKNLWKDGKLFRRYREGNLKYSATIDDYSFLVFALLELYESDPSPNWLKWSQEIQKSQDERLWDEESFGYYTSEASDKTIIYRKKDLNDGAIPSGNSIAALNLFKLYHFTFDKKYKEKAERQLAFLSTAFQRYPSGFPQALQVLDFYLDTVKEIVVIGKKADPKFKELENWFYNEFYPNMLSLFLEDDKENSKKNFPALVTNKKRMHAHFTAYICENHTCKEPVGSIAEFKSQLKK